MNRNNAAGLHETIQSLRTRQPDLFEHIIVDGASSDSSVEIARRARNGISQMVLSEPDRGIYDAMNKGATLASGQLLFFLNSGDVVAHSAALDELTEWLMTLKQRPRWIVARFLHGSALEPIGQPFSISRFWMGSQQYNHQAMLFDRKLFLALGGYSELAGFAADAEYMMRASVVEGPTEPPVTLVRFDATGASSRLVEYMPLVFHEYRTKLLALSGFPAFVSLSFGLAQYARRQGITRLISLSKERVSRPSNW